jgi:hypothetical protein
MLVVWLAILNREVLPPQQLRRLYLVQAVQVVPVVMVATEEMDRCQEVVLVWGALVVLWVCQAQEALLMWAGLLAGLTRGP